MRFLWNSRSMISPVLPRMMSATYAIALFAIAHLPFERLGSGSYSPAPASQGAIGVPASRRAAAAFGKGADRHRSAIFSKNSRAGAGRIRAAFQRGQKWSGREYEKAIQAGRAVRRARERGARLERYAE
jgi:hypothetical protein